MTKPRLLDLYCGAGGASAGYACAGFDVTGVDHRPQRRYPYGFIRADALAILADLRLLAGFDVIHASPPCQRYSAATKDSHRTGHPDSIGEVRRRLDVLSRPYVIENVPGAPLQVVPDLFDDRAGVLLCGSMFDLRVRRHRLFESNVPIPQPRCRHQVQGPPLSVTGTGYGGRQRGHNGTKPSGVAEAREVMGIPWMTIAELSQAIPPAYTEFIGAALIRAIR